jgi:hypothetical protein
MLAINAQLDLLSIGKLAELLQRSPRRIEQAAIAASVPPALRLNMIPYFAEADVDKIREQLDRGDE